MASLKILFWINLLLCIASFILEGKDVYAFGFLIISSVFFVGLEIVKNIHRSTVRHMKHNSTLLNIMIDKLKVNK
jgi:hypothetical protein